MNDETYFDKRSDFWREHFEEALDYEGYLKVSDPAYVSRWEATGEALPALAAEQRDRLAALNTRRLNTLVYSGIWCGDCSRQVPMLKAVLEAAGQAEHLRILDRDYSEELKNELRILGAMRVPVTVFLSEDFHEVARVGDRTLVTYRRKLVTETGAACDTGLMALPEEALAAEQAEWADFVERMLLMLRLAPPLRQRYGD